MLACFLVKIINKEKGIPSLKKSYKNLLYFTKTHLFTTLSQHKSQFGKKLTLLFLFFIAVKTKKNINLAKLIID